MRVEIILHSLLIFFSGLLTLFYGEGFLAASLVLFLMGLLFFLLTACRIYGLGGKPALLVSGSATMILGIVVVYLCLHIPLVTLAVSILDIFFVLQPLFWAVALRPTMIRCFLTKKTCAGASIFILSLAVAILSLATCYVLVYSTLYLFFCLIAHRYVLEESNRTPRE